MIIVHSQSRIDTICGVGNVGKKRSLQNKAVARSIHNEHDPASSGRDQHESAEHSVLWPTWTSGHEARKIEASRASTARRSQVLEAPGRQAPKHERRKLAMTAPKASLMRYDNCSFAV